MYTVLHSSDLLLITFKASRTIRPATIALVLAIAGIILPASALIEKII